MEERLVEIIKPKILVKKVKKKFENQYLEMNKVKSLNLKVE